MKKASIFFLLILSCIVLKAQNQTAIDSLKGELIKVTDIQTKLKIYYELSEQTESPIIAIKYADSCYLLSKRENNLRYEGLSLYLKGYNTISLGKIDSAKIFLEQSIIIADKNKIPEIRYESYKELAYIYELKNNIDSALVYYQYSFDAAQQLDRDELINAYRNLGDILQMKGKYKEATEKYLRGLELNNERNNKTVSAINFGLGNLHFMLKKYPEAKKYYLDAISIGEKYGASKRNIQVLKQGLLQTLTLTEDYKEALELVNDLLKDKELSPILEGSLFSHLGEIYSFMGNFNKAEEYFNKSIVSAKQLGNKKYEIVRQFRLASLYSKEGNFNKSNHLIIEFIDSYPEFLQLGDQAEVYRLLTKNQLGLYGETNSINEFDKYTLLKDSLNSIDYLKNINDLKEKYQSQQKENQILQLTNQNIQKEAALTQSRYITYGSLGFVILLLSLSYLFWAKQKQKQQVALLENTVKTSEQEKNRIGKELHDGIAGTLIKLVHDSEAAQMQLSHKLLQTYNEVRNLSHQLDNSPVHGELFIERVLDIIPESNDEKHFDFKITPRHLELNEPYGTHIYRIIQELIANNLKHAKASKTTISISVKEDRLLLSYIDNGIGASTIKKQNGIKNIEDRITLLNGALKINAQKDKGFELNADIPYT